MRIRDVGLAIALALATCRASARGRAQQIDSVPDVRIVISIAERRLWVVSGAEDTLRTAPVAVGSGRRLSGGGRSWTFNTRRGRSTVVRKEVDPFWIPPDWHFIERAREHGWRVEQLSAGRPRPLADGTSLTVRDGRVGLITKDSTFAALPIDDEIVFGSTLYIPPLGTVNRRVAGVLGPYRLVLANGVGLHGTPYKESIGTAATHGCIRLLDEDITWLYEHVPVGAHVLIF